MIVYVCILGLIFLIGIRLRKNDSGILSQNDTTIINGVFTILILISHSTQYYKLSGNFLDSLYVHFRNFHNQWVVATFLAFSGYGVMNSIMAKGQKYIDEYPKNRILKTLINFDIAVVLYLVLNILLNIKYSTIDIFFSFIGLTGIGNSNWYIFDILIMYIVSYLAAKEFHNDYSKQAVMTIICTVIFIAVMKIANMPSRFVSTIMCYPFGVFICVYKDRIITLIKSKKNTTVFVIVFILGITYKLRYDDYIMNIASIFFVLSFIWFEVFFELDNKLLKFIGNHAFSIYILQRIPMIVFSHYGILVQQPYMFVLSNMAITILVAVLFDYFVNKVDKILLK